MTAEDRSALERVAQFQRTYPVDVSALAEALGVRVKTAFLSDDISGKIERDALDDDYVVTFNFAHAPVRQRFTVAHELAHYILHRDLIGEQGIVDNALYRDARLGDAKERQANRYAASLLMPLHLVRQAWGAGLHTKEQLARAFEVSPAVAEIRMRELGCVLWPKSTARSGDGHAT